jgi:hypothetical protein
MTVQVMNRNEFALHGRYNGRNYTFAPGLAVEVPEEAVKHIFGFEQENRTGAYNRLGLLKPPATMEMAQAIIDRVHFMTGKMVFEEPQPVPPPEPRGPGKNEEPEDEEESESGKASAQQLAPGGSTDVERSASAIPVKKKRLTTLERIEANERKREHK